MWEQAKWIWIDSEQGMDEYAEFYAEFTDKTGRAVCRLSCDGDYTLFINGEYVASNQYGDFEHYKIYDEIDLSSHLKKGTNELKILVWHYGEESQRYLPAKAGLLFEIEDGEGVVFRSDEGTLCRRNSAYRNGYCKIISPQLGFSFLYDATAEEAEPLSPAVSVKKLCTLYPRPVKKLTVGGRADITVLKSEDRYFLIDLGRESVGLPVLELFSEKEQKITVFWGEDLQNGHVRGIIGNRSFSYEYIAKKGHNEYTNYMLRVGCRYLEVYSEDPIELKYAGILPQYYAVEREETALDDPTDRKIYDMCVKTLELCMMEHYVDTPWREQCLYAFDARNQMLCGYYAFRDGNKAFARANLKLISEDRREDGLLSICCPCGKDLTIPSFSLYYFLAVGEYTEHTGDETLAREVYPKLLSVAETFVGARKDGLVYRFAGKSHWNFYDWSPYMDGTLGKSEESIPDLMLNCLLILALESLREICKKINEAFPYGEIIEEEKRETRRRFYSPENRLFSMTESVRKYTVLGNAMAILAGLTSREEAEFICEKTIFGELMPCSLSMKTFVYDALLQTDREKYEKFILAEIRRDYQKMAEQGSTCVWETTEGAAAFGNAGSLCHGWSAIPIYYYKTVFAAQES